MFFTLLAAPFLGLGESGGGSVVLSTNVGAGGPARRRGRPNYSGAEIDKLQQHILSLERQLKNKGQQPIPLALVEEPQPLAPQTERRIMDAAREALAQQPTIESRDISFKREYIRRFNALVKRKLG